MAFKCIMYIERKDDAQTSEAFLRGGYARIGRVTFSRTMHSLHYAGKTFARVRGFKHNFMEEGSGDYYWISGCKKDGGDRLYGERVPIHIDDDVREEYWREIRELPEYAHIKVRYDGD